MYLYVNIEEAGRKIVDISITPEINYPSELFNYGVACEPIVYTKLIYKCIHVLGFGEFHDDDLPRTPIELEDALSITYQWLNEGYVIYEKKTGGKRPPDETPFGYYLNAFEQERNKDPDQAIKIYPAYYLLAMLFLVDYKHFCLASFRDIEEFNGVKTDPAPYRQSIDALGALLNAQLCVELGSASLERAFGNVRVADVTNQLAVLKERQQHAQRGLSETNDAKAWLQAKARNIAEQEWKEDAEELFRIGAMADHIRTTLPTLIDEDCTIQLEQKWLLKNTYQRLRR